MYTKLGSPGSGSACQAGSIREVGLEAGGGFLDPRVRRSRLKKYSFQVNLVSECLISGRPYSTHDYVFRTNSS